MAKSKKVKIVVIGENCDDIFVYGECRRLCPEGPVPVFTPISTMSNGGCAANVVNNLISLSDHTVDVRFLTHNTTLVKTRYVDKHSGHLLLRVDENDVIPYDETFTNSQFFETITEIVDVTSAIVISDYGKGFLSKDDIEFISSFAIEHNIPVFMDTKFILGEFSKNIDYVKINKKEYDEHVKRGISPELFCKNLIVTLGHCGCNLYKDGKFFANFPAESIEKVYNVSGAGDTFLSAFVLRLIETNHVDESIAYANRAASIAVSNPGVVAVTKTDVQKRKLI